MMAGFAGLVGEDLTVVVQALSETITQLEAMPTRTAAQQITLQRRRRLRDRLSKAI